MPRYFSNTTCLKELLQVWDVYMLFLRTSGLTFRRRNFLLNFSTPCI
jgi:hypothetical protein